MSALRWTRRGLMTSFDVEWRQAGGRISWETDLAGTPASHTLAADAGEAFIAIYTTQAVEMGSKEVGFYVRSITSPGAKNASGG